MALLIYHENISRFRFDKRSRLFSTASIALVVIVIAVLSYIVPAWAAQPNIINPIPNQNATEDAVFNFQFASDTFEDTDEHTLTYTAQLAGGGALSAWLSFDSATRTFSGTPSNSVVGTISIDVIADDGEGASTTDTFDITVANTNDSPAVANAIPNQNATEDAAFNFQFTANTFSDIDVGDVLTYSAQLAGGGALPGWLSFNALTRTFSGTPNNGDVGTVSIDVVADDGNGGSVTDTFTITIANTHDAPTVVNAIPDRIATSNNIFNLRFAYDTFDGEGNTLTYSAQLAGGGALPTWLAFNSSSRTFSGTPSNVNIGTVSIDVIADDNLGGTVTDTFNIEVVAALAYSGTGDGSSEESAYIITNCEQLQEISKNLGAWYRLSNDIDCSDTANWNGGAGFVPIGSPEASFLGTLEGAGYTISGLTINLPNANHVGLFGYTGAWTGNYGLTQQFMLKDVSIRGQNYVGAVAGESWGNISEVGVTGAVEGVHVVGGVAGNNSSSILNVYSHATISGLIGSGVGGGLVGQNGGFTLRSYSTGAVPVGTGKGGLVGDDFGSGGVSGAFWDTQTSGSSVSDEGVGKTTAELKNVATFTDQDTIGLGSAWDFKGNPNDDTEDDDIWDINPLINQGYPYLTALVPAVPVPDVTITEPPVIPVVHADTIQASPVRDVAAAPALSPPATPVAEKVMIDDGTVKPDSADSIAQANDSSSSDDGIKKPEISSTNFTPWIIGFLMIILTAITYSIYRRIHRDNTK